MPRHPPAPAGPLATDVAGIAFTNPVGMGAGFDKDAEVPDALLGLGFGFAEVGSITPRPQQGNARPRLFRLPEDKAVINRMGFNNGGADAALARLAARKQGAGIVGVNIGANKDSPDWIADYMHMARVMAPYASYLAVNVSSPNTPGLRALQDASALGALLDAVLAGRGADGPVNKARLSPEPDRAAGSESAGSSRPDSAADAPAVGPPRPDTAAGPRPAGPPVFLKVAPDLQPGDIDDIARIAMDRKLGGLIVSNTTVSRPPLASRHARETGGLSGAPLKPLALETLRAFRRATGGALPLVGVGGIAAAEDAWERIRAGASLVQLYSAMIYCGPGIARQILTGMEKLMRRDGFATIAEAVGSE
jgi:dihydroorotate dehydrogenase